VVRPLPPQAIDRYGLAPVVANLAQWLAFQLSIWHEIATWFGWASVPGFSERAFAFSPEDLYSNLAGTKLVLALIYQHEVRNEELYNRAVDAWLAELLALLGAVPRELGREATAAVNGLWWDSSRRLPDPKLVLRRNFGIEAPIRPWQVPDSALSDGLRAQLDAACGGDRTPIDFANSRVRGGVVLPDWVSLEISVDDSLARQEPFATRGRELTQADFPAVVEAIRVQARAESGPRVDQRE
jgi:hypothetical protein